MCFLGQLVSQFGYLRMQLGVPFLPFILDSPNLDHPVIIFENFVRNIIVSWFSSKCILSASFSLSTIAIQLLESTICSRKPLTRDNYSAKYATVDPDYHHVRRSLPHLLQFTDRFGLLWCMNGNFGQHPTGRLAICWQSPLSQGAIFYHDAPPPVIWITDIAPSGHKSLKHQ